MPRIRISAGPWELDVEGDENFVGRYEQPIASMLARLENDALPGEDSPRRDAGRKGGSGNQTRALDFAGLEFGQALQLLPSGASGTDQILLAGRFAQEESETDTFSTRDANQLLVSQGVKLANASQSLKSNLIAKRVFKVQGSYRVSETGELQIQELVAAANSEAS